MSDPTSRALARRKPVAACVAAAFCLAAPIAAVATTWQVNTCLEPYTGSGTAGSLRYAAQNANSGDIIDLTNTGCSGITLTTGAVVLAQADITLQGPGKTAFALASTNDRVVRHSGSGVLTVKDLTVANGYYHPALGTQAAGGCIRSNGAVSLDHALVRSCRAVSNGAVVRGGGIYAANNVYAKYSDIRDNTASSSNSANVNGGGGGIFTYKDVTLANSTVSGNSAQTGSGGGVRTFGNALIIASTISGNTASQGGGIYARNPTNSKALAFSLANSTVSGNSATGLVGGAWTNAGTIQAYNTTLAFNTAGSASNFARDYSPGLNVDDTGAYYTDITHSAFKQVRMIGAVLSNNASGTFANDFGITRFSNMNLVRFSDANGSSKDNLIFATSLGFAPTVAKTGVCPLLGPLRDNGGPSQTHALMSHSPAIDAVPATSASIGTLDQRGLPRKSNAVADAGAYEVQQADVIFNNGHEGCS